MAETLRLMCIFAHPDDESLGVGWTLAKYAAEGVESYLVCATRGERGWGGEPEFNPGLEGLGRIRTGELQAAARVLGIREIHFLNYIDGDLDKAPAAEAIARIVPLVRRLRPHVVITFDPFGSYGHPDHIAISQFAQGAVLCAADAAYKDGLGLAAYRVPKLYYMIDNEPMVKIYTELLGEITMRIDGVDRQLSGWPMWTASAVIDVRDYWETAMEAIACHVTQVQPWMTGLRSITKKYDPAVWGVQTFYRVYSLVNSGRQAEKDLFEGLRG